MSDRNNYDPRTSGSRHQEDRHRPSSARRDRSRSRSRSPEPANRSSSATATATASASASASASADTTDKQFQDDRRSRMARLRQEMKEEDREMAALDNVEEVAPKLAPQEQIIQVNEEELEGLDEDEQMQMLLGFTGGFGSTKGEAVEDNQASAARGAAAKNKARKYRQYMNRKNGFNRPLEKMD